MTVKRIRPALFPKWPPYLTFIGPNEEYEDGKEAPKELTVNFIVAKGSSPLILECLLRFGDYLVQVSQNLRSMIEKIHNSFFHHSVI